MIYTDYIELDRIQSGNDLTKFARKHHIECEWSSDPYETIITLSRYGDKFTKTFSNRETYNEIMLTTKQMIKALLSDGSVCSPGNLFIAGARGNGKTRLQMEYFKTLLGINNLAIKNVIFNDPATIVFWSDGTKTVVKAENEAFDPEKGLAMAISKKALGNQGNYFNEFKRWLPEENERIFRMTEGELIQTLEFYHSIKMLEKNKDNAPTKEEIKKVVFETVKLTHDDKIEAISESVVDEFNAISPEELKKTCVACQFVKPFKNDTCDKCLGYDKFKAMEEKDD